MDQYLSQVALLRVQNDQRTLGDICMRVHLGIYAATASALETDRAAWAVAGCASWSRPGLKISTGTGPETAVTGQTGPGWFRFWPVSNRPKFKIQI